MPKGQKLSRSDKKYILGAASGLLLGLGLAFVYTAYVATYKADSSACSKTYALTSQALPCMRFDAQAERLGALDAKLEEATALYIKEGKAARVSVWVRDLNTSQYAASNENETDTFAPASLLKLPLMIAYFKLAEIQPTLLKTELVYASTTLLNDNTQDFVPAQPFAAGSKHTVEELIEDMIVNSDNTAASVLLQHLDPQIFQNTLIDLGIEIPANDGVLDFVTVKSYGAIFRTLFNSTYLNRDFSEKALEIMSKEAFKGIAEPLPASLQVAHKFGEREVDNTDGTVATRELHDCGIIYAAGKPYTLCIMTEGSDFKNLQSIIEDLSTLTYQTLK